MPASLSTKISSSIQLSPLDEAKRVLKLEAEALTQMAEGLNDNFQVIVELILTRKGRVIISGMGKSGHIGRKIAATFASTGTPAFFVHPAEAAHGDLGMIEPHDTVIALSASGETAELGALITYCRRTHIPLVAMTLGADSTLAEAADYCLLLPKVPEACPLLLAPTTSTTMMIALGDALAMSLLQSRGFTAKDFGLFHPGGSLGRQLLRVADLMHKGEKLPLVREATSMSEAVLEMTTKTFGCAGVINEKRELIGIITDGDLRRHMSDNLLAHKVEEIMTSNPITIKPTVLAAEALGYMNERSITSLFVLEEGSNVPVGIIRLHDCLKVGI